MDTEATNGDSGEQMQIDQDQDLVVVEDCEAYSSYQHGFQRGVKHPQPLIEGAGLNSVPVPEFSHQLLMEAKWFTPEPNNAPHLSAPQIDAVILANQTHDEFFEGYLIKDGHREIKKFRKGFLLGDGTGVGKSREMAGILFESYLHELQKDPPNLVQKALFLTTNQALFEQLEEEILVFFEGNHRVKFLRIDSSLRDSNLIVGLNILIITYRTLTDESNLSDLTQWLGDEFDGHIFFDEAHAAKSAFNNVRQSRTGVVVLALQENHPNARITYSTATGASELHHLLVFQRLHLYGKGKRFKTEVAFVEEMKKRSVGGLELLGMTLKRNGQFLARQISFEGVNVYIETAVAQETFLQTVNMAIDLWTLLQEYMLRAEMPKDPEDKKVFRDLISNVRGQFYSQSLLFFSTLIVSSKLAYVDHTTRLALERKFAVIIGLQKTGQNRFKPFYKDPATNGLPYTNAGEILRSVMRDLLNINLGYPKAFFNKQNFVKLWNPTVEKDNGRKVHKEEEFQKLSQWTEFEIGTHGETELERIQHIMDLNKTESEALRSKLKQARQEKEQTRAAILTKWPSYSVGLYLGSREEFPELRTPEDLWWNLEYAKDHLNARTLRCLFHTLYLLLPINPLDEMRERFEKNRDLENRLQVAEMTSRKVDYTSDDTRPGCFRTIANPSKVSNEKRNFMSGQKKVAIISGVALTGVSLHADKQCGNRTRRLHLTIEVPFNPDGIVQQMGRSHRSNQVCPPRYVFAKSPISGEIRFTSIAVKRLKQLGAICHGHSLVNPITAKLSDNIYTDYGLQAIALSLNELAVDDDSNKYMLNVLGLEDYLATNRRLQSEAPDKSDALTDPDEKKLSRTFNRALMMPLEVQQKFVQDVERTALGLITDTGKRIYNGIIEFPAEGCHIKMDHSFRFTTGDLAYVFKHTRVMQWEEARQICSEGGRFYRDTDGMMKMVKTTRYEILDSDQFREEFENYAPFSRIPNKTAHFTRNVCLYGPDDSLALQWIQPEWEATAKKFLETPGCIHKVLQQDCEIPNCERSWGSKTLLIVTGWSERVLKKLNMYPIKLALVRYDVNYVGLLVEGDKANDFIKEMISYTKQTN